jgi:hypothetical protein
MSAVKFLYFHKLIALSITTLLVFWLISIWNINIWQQALLENKIKKQPSKELKESAQKKSILFDKQLKLTINDKSKSLIFANVDLPKLPKKPIDLITKIERTFKPNVKITKEPLTKTKSTKAVIKESTSAIYQQLVSDNSISIELAWPNESTARQSLLTFLYQCIGMKFGVLNNQNVTLANTFYQNVETNDKQKPSEWLRIAQGQLASQEHLWLQQYHLSGTPVRLFPKVVDWQLAKLINNQLKGIPLKSLRAYYNYDHQRLMLRNIRLNGERLSKSWILIESKCSI